MQSRRRLRNWSWAMLLFSGWVWSWPIVLWGKTHWAFQPVSNPDLPAVQDIRWPRQPLDYFILARLESAGIKPAPPADKPTLLRRAYIDLIGLLPSPREVEAFVGNSSEDAFARVVDHLLASPRYGERWGRHWLDVARYGDSNGGDENNPYPHAWRFRNWVIHAFNRDLPYDRFLHEQLAGDLLEPGNPDCLTATGFLAIGTKILAEKDPVKKQADIVDEQLDTIGRAFLGLTIGCARCHDHKFDPIPARDYYALAGIFHSTVIEDRPVLAPELAAAKAALAKKLEETDAQIAVAEKAFESWVDGDTKLEWEAEQFARGNVIVDTNKYGKGIGIISDSGGQDNFAEYDLELAQPAVHLVRLRYAALASRPGKILLDGKVVIESAMAKTTGGWMAEDQRWFIEGKVALSTGKHTLRIESKPAMSHIDKVQLVQARSESGATEALARLERLWQARSKLRGESAKAVPMAMAVKDGEVHDAKVNRRGDPHDLGNAVPRGFLSEIRAATAPLPAKQSGRLELADWMTSPNHPLTARVAVNRIWHWHFGRGLVGTPDNFGSTGEAPTHPELLDFLARQFVEGSWSVKALHRQIMLSSTYQMGSAESESGNAGAVHPGHLLRRLEAETFRDAVLQVSESLETQPPGGAPPAVKTQDPSPKDLDQNRVVYEQDPHRSVYLPIVRSHIYDLLTLLDFPNATTPVGDRDSTTVPTQALLMLNNPFLVEKANQLATSVRRHPDPFQELHLRLFARLISVVEREWWEDFLNRAKLARGEDQAWALLCQTLLISNDFLYVR